MENEATTIGEVLGPVEKPELRTCERCGGEFELPPFRIAAQFVKICPYCSDKQAVADQAEALKRSSIEYRREESWKNTCPTMFQDTERAKIPNPVRYDKVMEWAYGKKGLMAHGPSGRGKSRCMWELLKREHMAGRKWSVLNSSFGYDYAEQFEHPARLAKWINAKSEVEILLLDDVFKSRLTDSVEQAIFTIVNDRTERGKPLLITVNDTGETLLQRLSPDRGPALIRRLREFCETVSFL